MIRIKQVNLSNIVTYKSGSFPFTKGIHVVRGENRAGKSLLFSSLANVFYFSPPLEVKKNAAKIMHRSGSKLSIAVNHNNIDYVVNQLGRKSSMHWAITRNGVDLNQRVEIKDYIREQVFPIPEDLFYTTVYLNAFRQSKLLNGKPNERHDFFESLLNLSLHDEIRQKLSEELVTIKSDIAELRVVKNQAEELQDRLKEKGNSADLVKVYTETKDKMTRLRKSFLAKQRHLDNLDRYVKLAKKVKDLASPEALRAELKDTERKLKKTEGLLEEYQNDLVELEKTFTEISCLSEYQDSIDALKAQLPKKVCTVTQYNTWVKKYEAQLEEKEKLLENILDYVQIEEPFVIECTLEFCPGEGQGGFETDLVQTVNKSLKIKSKDLASLITLVEETTETLKSERWSLNSEVKELRVTAGTCPTCKQKIHNHAKFLAETASQLKTVTEKYNKFNNVSTYLQQGVQYLVSRQIPFSFKDQFIAIGVDVKTEQEECDGIKEKIEKYSQIKTVLLDLKDQQSKLDKIRKKSTSTESAKEIKARLLETKEKIAKLARAKSILNDKRDALTTNLNLLERLEDIELPDSLSNKPLADIEKFYLNTINAANKLNKELDELFDLSERTKVDIELIKSDQKTLVKMQEKLRGYEKLHDNLKVYEALISAYGGRGIRTIQVKNIVSMFVENMNSYAQLLFPEPFVFHTSLSPGQCSLIAERNYITVENKISGVPSDVRLLSGSESRCFQFLSFLSLMPFLPDNLRCNTVIFDELETGMTETSISMLTREFLPQLKDLVECIVFITPQSHKNFSVIGAKEYFVKKVNSVSEITALNQ